MQAFFLDAIAYNRRVVVLKKVDFMQSKLAVLSIALLCCAVFTTSHALQCTIYKTINKDGSITYSDQPSPGAIELSLDVNTSTMQSVQSTTLPKQMSTSKPQIAYTVNILSPAQDATIRNNMGNINIAASVEPKLGGFFQLSINEQIHESANGLFSLSQMDRGSYQYSVKFIDNSGKVIALSKARTLHLHKASSLIN